MAITETNAYGLDNHLPYTMTLTYSSASMPGDNGWTCWLSSSMPADSILPGAPMGFELISERQPPATGWATAELHYDFTDVDGGQHRCLYLVRSDGTRFVYSMDLVDGVYEGSTATFFIQPEGGNSAGCVLTNPAEVTIDATQDAAAATSVMGNLWPQGTNKQFTATTPDPTYLTGRVDAGCRTTSGSSTVTDTHITSGDVGQDVTGTGIPAGATIKAVTPSTSFTLSAPATATATGTASLTISGRVDAGCRTTSGSSTVTDTHITSGDVGQDVTGTGIPAGATIKAVTPSTSFTLSAPATATATGTASLTISDWSRGSAVVVNGSAGQVTLELDAGDTKEEETSIGLELSWSTSLDILGIVNEQVSASVSLAKDWSTSYTEDQSYNVTIDPGQQGWLQWAASSAQITGDFTFTWTAPTGGAGITYHVTNATVTEPGRNGNPAVPAVTWRPYVELNPTSTQRKAIYGGVTIIPARPSPSPRLTGNPSVDIDAATDPDGAAQAMQLWPNATNTNFTTTSNPVYTSTQPQVLSDAYQVPADQTEPESTSFTKGMTSSSSWSIGGSVGEQTTLSALELVNTSVSVTFSASHQWSTSQTNTQTITVEVLPGYESWITGSQDQATFTGDYTFTAQGTDYTVRNVTITYPAAANAGPMTAFTYFVVDQKLPASVAATLTRPGWAAAPPNRPDAAIGSRLTE